MPGSSPSQRRTVRYSSSSYSEPPLGYGRETTSSSPGEPGPGCGGRARAAPGTGTRRARAAVNARSPKVRIERRHSIAAVRTGRRRQRSARRGRYSSVDRAGRRRASRRAAGRSRPIGVDGAEGAVVAAGADARVEQQVVEVPLPQRSVRVGGERPSGRRPRRNPDRPGDRTSRISASLSPVSLAGAPRPARLTQGGDESPRGRVAPAARGTSPAVTPGPARPRGNGRTRTGTAGPVRRRPRPRRGSPASRAVGSSRSSSRRSGGSSCVSTLCASS